MRAISVVGLAGLVLGSFATNASAVYTFTNVADNTTAAPSGTFASFDQRPSISGSTVAFNSYFDDNSNQGVFSVNGGVLTTIAQLGDAAPTGTFDLLDTNGTGISSSTVVFNGLYNAYADRGIFTGNGGPLTTIAKTGDVAPLDTFSNFVGPTPISGSTVAFTGDYNANNSRGIFTGNGGPLTTIAKKGDDAPSGTFNSFQDPAISGGTVAFHGSYAAFSGQGIFTGSGGPLTTIAKSGDAAPIGTFIEFSFPAISGATVAFIASYNTYSGLGIFTGSGESLTTIVKKGDAAPAGTFQFFGEPAISGSTVAFSGSWSGGSSNGIFTGSGGPLTTVIKTGDPLFGGTVGLVYMGRFGIDANGSGNLAFQYSLIDGRYGIAIAVPSPAILPGDYNEDGTVDAADYVVWRKNEGTTNSLPNDPIGGIIGSAQFDQWRAHFGETAGSGSLSDAAVPEPSTLMLLILAATLWHLQRRLTI